MWNFPSWRIRMFITTHQSDVETKAILMAAWDWRFAVHLFRSCSSVCVLTVFLEQRQHNWPFDDFVTCQPDAAYIWEKILPFLQRFTSASSLWIVSFNDLFFSFSLWYFFFHCSAVSSRFTDTVFLMVLALIGYSEKQRESGMEGAEDVWSSSGSEQKYISASAAQYKWACISLINMQIGFLPTEFHTTCRESYSEKSVRKYKALLN